MSLLNLFDNPIWHRWALTLIHFLWQGSAIVLLLVLAMKSLRIRTAQGRYAAHLAALSLLLFSPLITFILIDPLPSLPTLAVTHIRLTTLESDDISPAQAPTNTIESATTIASPAAPAASTLTSLITTLQPWIASLWLVGVLLLSIRLSASVITIRRLRAHRVEPSQQVSRLVRRLAAALGLANPPILQGCPILDEPAATGILRPVILIPASWLTRMPIEMLEAIIAHELSHIRRFDLWVNLIQRIVETIFFFHPATWWLSSRIRIEREICCDELAVAVTREKLTYVHTLEYVARKRLARVRPALAVHMGGARMALLQRVRNILGLQTPQTDSSIRGWIGGIAALAVPVVLAGSSLLITPAVTNNPGNAALAADDDDDDDDDRDDRKEKPREAEQPRREGDRPLPPPPRREGEKPREGDRPREQDRPREGDRPREADRPREGDKPLPPPRREGEKPREGDRPREGDKPRDVERRPEGEARPPAPRTEQDELRAVIRELRAEVDRLRREVAEMREQRGGERPLPPREGDRREGDKPAPRPPVREGERREGDRPLPPPVREGERREGDKPAPRPPVREGERREGDRPLPPPPREGERRGEPERSRGEDRERNVRLERPIERLVLAGNDDEAEVDDDAPRVIEDDANEVDDDAPAQVEDDANEVDDD